MTGNTATEVPTWRSRRGWVGERKQAWCSRITDKETNPKEPKIPQHVLIYKQTFRQYQT